MISIPMRILLILGSLFTVGLMLRRIRNSKIQIRDSIFWILFSLVLLLLSVFPDIAGLAAGLLGIQSPINFVFLLIIFLLLIQTFLSAVRISQLDAKVKLLAQKLALDQKLEEEQTSLSASAGTGTAEPGKKESGQTTSS